MEAHTEVAMVRKNKLNGQKTITVPKKIEALDEYDNVKISQDKGGKVLLEKLNQ